MAEVRTQEVSIILDQREAENLAAVLHMLGPLVEDYHLGSLDQALKSHSILPDWWAFNKRLVLEDSI